MAQDELAALTEDVATFGADRILVCADPTLGEPPLDATHGPLLSSLADRLRPVLVLFPAGSQGPELAPPLAVHLGASYHPRAALEVVGLEAGSTSTVVPHLLLHRRTRGSELRVIDLGTSHRARPVVATLGAGPVEPPRRGGPNAELQVVSGAETKGARFEEIFSEPDMAARAELASVIVVTDRASAEESALPPSCALLSPDAPVSTLEAVSPRLLIFVGPQDAASDFAGEVDLLPTTDVAVTTKKRAKAATQARTPTTLLWSVGEEQAFGALMDAFRVRVRGPGETPPPRTSGTPERDAPP
jgi:hypothetical protein